MILGDPIATGNTAKIYLHDKNIVKVFNDYLPDTESIREADKQNTAYSCGIPVPKVLDVTKINGKQAIIMEYVKGETLGELMFKDMQHAESLLDISVDVQLSIHQIFPSTIEPMQEKLSRQIKSVNLLNKEKKSFLLELLESMNDENRFCHGDFHLFNLIKTENSVVVIDWVDASSGDIRADVYRTYLLYSQHSSELADTYLKLYCKKSGISRAEVFQWAPIIAAARLSETVSSENSDRLLEIIHHYCP